MSRAKIAPLVHHAVRTATYEHPAAANGRKAEAELRALLAVANAAKRLDRAMDNRNGADTIWSIEDERESNKRALARLERLSSRTDRGRAK